MFVGVKPGISLGKKKAETKLVSGLCVKLSNKESISQAGLRRDTITGDNAGLGCVCERERTVIVEDRFSMKLPCINLKSCALKCYTCCLAVFWTGGRLSGAASWSRFCTDPGCAALRCVPQFDPTSPLLYPTQKARPVRTCGGFSRVCVSYPPLLWCGLPRLSSSLTSSPCSCVISTPWSPTSGVATVYVRYKQVMALNPDKPRLLQLNTVGLVLGLISSFGLCIVANFQKNTMISMHLVGAILTFGIGTLYILFQTIISHKMQPHIHGMGVFWVRLCLGLWCSASIVTMFVSSVIMYSSLPGVDVAKKLHWNPEETGYSAHIVSTISEWSLAFSFLSFFLTYIQDFQKITLRAEATLQSRHLFNGPQFNVNVRAYNAETTPLLAGSI